MFRLKFLPSACLCLLALSSGAVAGTVSGELGFLGERMPALQVHAWQPATGQHLIFTTSRQQHHYSVALPAGRWVLFARPDEPGAPDLYGAYTGFAACARDPNALRAGACTDHDLQEIPLWKNSRVDGVDLTDWSLSDAALARLDSVLGHSPGESYSAAALAAPRFSEYPATVLPPDTASTAVTAEAGDPRLTRDQAAIADALARGPNFAGVLSLFAVPASTGNVALGLLDLRSGWVRWPPLLSELPEASACAEAAPAHSAVQFRRDSRLLTLTRQEGDQLVTRYLVWSEAQNRFETLTTLTSVAPERCQRR